MHDVLVRLEDISFSYQPPETELFHGLTHDFPCGAVTALTGPSGRGKSTLLYLLGLLLTPTRGTVIVGGQPASRAKDAARASIRSTQIGFVFQDAELDPFRNVLDSVIEPALYAGKTSQEVTRKAMGLLERFDLQDRAGHRPGQVSGGQAQRLALCRALINDPSVILADEPTGNLDQGNSAAVLETLRQSASDGGATVIIATHDPFVVERADEVIRL